MTVFIYVYIPYNNIKVEILWSTKFWRFSTDLRQTCLKDSQWNEPVRDTLIFVLQSTNSRFTVTWKFSGKVPDYYYFSQYYVYYGCNGYKNHPRYEIVSFFTIRFIIIKFNSACKKLMSQNEQSNQITKWIFILNFFLIFCIILK